MDIELNTSEILSALEWLLNRLEDSPMDVLRKICTVLYGIWMGRNDKVWNNKVLSGQLAIESSFRQVRELREARDLKSTGKRQLQPEINVSLKKWKPPEVG